MPLNPEVPNRSIKPGIQTNQGYPGQYPAYPQQYPAPPNQYGVQINSNTFQFQGQSQPYDPGFAVYSAQTIGPGTSSYHMDHSLWSIRYAIISDMDHIIWSYRTEDHG